MLRRIAHVLLSARRQQGWRFPTLLSSAHRAKQVSFCGVQKGIMKHNIKIDPSPIVLLCMTLWKKKSRVGIDITMKLISEEEIQITIPMGHHLFTVACSTLRHRVHIVPNLQEASKAQIFFCCIWVLKNHFNFIKWIFK